MDYESAQSVGAAGELAVSQVLQRIGARYGFRHLDNVLLEVKPMTGQFDHVVVDRHGILIIESKVRRDALIRGNDSEKRWTACYRNGRKEPFLSPLGQNREHENLLRQALRGAQPALDPDYIESAVVFVGADLSQLALKSTERSRVIDIGELERFFAERGARERPAGQWTPGQVDERVNQLVALDRSSDPAVLRHHSDYRSGRAPTGPRAPARATPPSSGAAEAYLAAKSSGSRRSGALHELADGLTRLLISIVLIGLLWLFAVSGLADWAIRGAIGMLFPSSRTTGTTSTALPKTGADLRTAKQRLREVAPEVASAVANLDSPRVSQAGDETTYTWRYILRPRPDTAVVRTFTLVLGPDGSVRHMGASD
jgi:hypothetical protein